MKNSMKRVVFGAALMVLLMAVGAWPAVAKPRAAACYTRSEAEAEQGIRIHSELMVIGLNCQHKYRTANGENLYLAYRKFSAQHGTLFAGYEAALLKYFRRQGAGDPEAALNDLRTAFANKISGDAAKMRPDLFCYQYAPRIQKAALMDDKTVQRWAATFFPGHPVSRPVCQ